MENENPQVAVVSRAKEEAKIKMAKEDLMALCTEVTERATQQTDIMVEIFLLKARMGPIQSSKRMRLQIQENLLNRLSKLEEKLLLAKKQADYAANDPEPDEGNKQAGFLGLAKDLEDVLGSVRTRFDVSRDFIARTDELQAQLKGRLDELEPLSYQNDLVIRDLDNIIQAKSHMLEEQSQRFKELFPTSAMGPPPVDQ